MKHKSWILVAFVAMLVLVGGGLAYAVQSEEQPPREARPAERPPPQGLAGQVIQIDDESLTIKTRKGEVVVLLTEETTFRVPGVEHATLADIKVGAAVVIQTETGESNTLTARAIIVRPPRRLQENFVRGTIKDLSDGEIQVETKDGETATILINDKIRIWELGKPPTTTLTLEIGDPLLALGTPAPTDEGGKTLSAQLLVVVSDEDLPKVVVQGQAAAITQQTIVVQTGRGERAITVLPRTRLQSARGRLGSLRDIPQRAQVIALGQPTEMGQWIAGLVLVPGSEPLARNGLRGEVLAKDASAGTLTVETEQRGEITVVTGKETRYRVPDVEEPGFDDIQVGNPVIVIGRFEEGSETIFLARGIDIQLPKGEKKNP